jgi:predicted TIM-barrel fold metal-dependent hydrolase
MLSALLFLAACVVQDPPRRRDSPEPPRRQDRQDPPKKLQNIDVHVHLWSPRGPGPRSEGESDYEAAGKNLLEHMDRYGIARALLMPPPRTRGNERPDEIGALKKLVKDYPQRFALAAGGDVLSPMIHETKADAVTKEIRERFEREALRLAAEGVKAFGELSALHLSFNEDHVFEETLPDHPLFLALADISAKTGIPIDLHMEAVEKEMATPAGFGDRNPEMLKANIPALERLLKHNRKARIVWQHIGWDNTGQMTLDLLRRLLKGHENLFMALRIEERAVTRDKKPMPHRIVDRQGKVVAEWAALLEEFPDRFVIGSDEFFTRPGSPKRWPQSFEETWRMLDQLKEELAAKIGRENAKRIYNLQ